MSDEKLLRLKNDWDVFKQNPLDSNIEREWRLFLKWKHKVDISSMPLEQYTDLRDGEGEPYFTYLIERKTENCGRFRAASSYGYGVYRVRPKKAGEQPTPEYRTADNRGAGENGTIRQAAAEAYFISKVRPVLAGLTRFEDLEIKPLEINFARKVAYMYQPGRLLALYKNEVIRAIAAYIGIDDTDERLDGYKATEAIKTQLDAAWSITASDASWSEETVRGWGLSDEDASLTLQFELSQKLGSFLFRRFGESFEMKHKNIIFYGAPGTGKTYKVEQAIGQMGLLEGRSLEQMREFVQFHPSYSYEDFIEGLKPVNTQGGISLELQSGMFKRFCRKAMQELRIARSARREPKNFYFVADEINRAELSRVLGEVLVCLEESKRVDFDTEGRPTGLRLKTQYGHLCKPDDAVLTIEGEHYFGIPSNLFFIGTMNDIDRSIDSFDMALRRRFVWQRMECDYGVIRDHFAGDKKLDRYVAICKRINYFIREELSLGYAYEIGHAYFTSIDKNRRISELSVKALFDMKIAPLLAEYLRAEYSPKELEGKLREAAGIFTLAAAANAEE